MKLTGYIVDEATRDTLSAALDSAQESRGRKYLHLGAAFIHKGANAGKYFIGLADSDLTQKVAGIMLKDYTEFQDIIASLGGLDARVEIDSAGLIDPNAEIEP